MRRDKVRAVAMLLLALYLGSYAYFRFSDQIVHRQNKGIGLHTVAARADEWSNLLEPPKGNALAAAYMHVQREAPNWLNGFYAPLRFVEAAGWNVLSPQ